ncbi:hypothetical protein HY091_02825 [Candidatus Kaiserbacteria bacterium]|nr:hypothetical protein [Candidatus Kaiserbacteria bacterium]
MPIQAQIGLFLVYLYAVSYGGAIIEICARTEPGGTRRKFFSIGTILAGLIFYTGIVAYEPVALAGAPSWAFFFYAAISVLLFILTGFLSLMGWAVLLLALKGLGHLLGKMGAWLKATADATLALS